MADAARAMVLTSFLGDSLALGVHWIYDQQLLAEVHGRIDRLKAPGPDSYHPGKQAGDFTHYGDQTMVLLESLARAKGFDAEDFSRAWRAHFEGGAPSYVDRATRNTLNQLVAGWEYGDAGSISDDLAGASRIAPLVYLLHGDEEALVAACRRQTTLTHNNGKVGDSAEFFARTTAAVLGGTPPREAMARALAGRLPGSPLHQWFADAQAQQGTDCLTAINRFGQSCHVDGAFQSTVQVILRHQDAPAEALVDSTMAGGDSAARNMLIGMVLGAWRGLDALPPHWLEALKARGKIETLLDALDAAPKA
ncbi:ADP-ribosylglycohydrolase family protein [Fundidesulfovibrio agrisoli]|uniref:ADP-ribosylglycohydrolase family protein n=1 Tax=Fundidesulfovibrio agrisoli TaxID=2922717 RepID=UPI001FAE203E|nr:ADP-ribosylglycohydrolase family protein [Fundidesulfovibrio agrisoli]